MQDRTLAPPQPATMPDDTARATAMPGPQHDELAQLASMIGASPRMAEQRAQRDQVPPNRTGLPAQLKHGIEALSGMSMDHVRVHYNSSKPAQLQAHAYAQGSEIHLASGQERHLPHEAWHVVQQAQGRVRPTMRNASGKHINNDPTLEAEADRSGFRAASLVLTEGADIPAVRRGYSGSAVRQGFSSRGLVAQFIWDKHAPGSGSSHRTSGAQKLFDAIQASGGNYIYHDGSTEAALKRCASSFKNLVKIKADATQSEDRLGALESLEATVIKVDPGRDAPSVFLLEEIAAQTKAIIDRMIAEIDSNTGYGKRHPQAGTMYANAKSKLEELSVTLEENKVFEEDMLQRPTLELKRTAAKELDIGINKAAATMETSESEIGRFKVDKVFKKRRTTRIELPKLLGSLEAELNKCQNILERQKEALDGVIQKKEISNISALPASYKKYTTCKENAEISAKSAALDVHDYLANRKSREPTDASIRKAEASIREFDSDITLLSRLIAKFAAESNIHVADRALYRDERVKMDRDVHLLAARSLQFKRAVGQGNILDKKGFDDNTLLDANHVNREDLSNGAVTRNTEIFLFGEIESAYKAAMNHAKQIDIKGKLKKLFASARWKLGEFLLPKSDGQVLSALMEARTIAQVEGRVKAISEAIAMYDKKINELSENYGFDTFVKKNAEKFKRKALNDSYKNQKEEFLASVIEKPLFKEISVFAYNLFDVDLEKELQKLSAEMNAEEVAIKPHKINNKLIEKEIAEQEL